MTQKEYNHWYYINVTKPKREKKRKQKKMICKTCGGKITNYKLRNKRYCKKECYLVANKIRARERKQRINLDKK